MKNYTINKTMVNYSNTTPSKTEQHIITSVEAQWLRIPMTFTDEGLDYQEIELSEAQEGMVSATEDEWEYECSCGESFNSTEEAENHLRQKQ